MPWMAAGGTTACLSGVNQLEVDTVLTLTSLSSSAVLPRVVRPGCDGWVPVILHLHPLQ